MLNFPHIDMMVKCQGSKLKRDHTVYKTTFRCYLTIYVIMDSLYSFAINQKSLVFFLYIVKCSLHCRLETEILAAAAVGYSDLHGLSNSDGKWESLSSAVNNVWHRQGRSAVDNRWAEPCAHEAFWLCAGGLPMCPGDLQSTFI